MNPLCLPPDLDPLILSPDKSVLVNRGESVELSCSATGSQTPGLSWRKVRGHFLCNLIISELEGQGHFT